jgi:outer membrane protein assembly factor BamE (lipoprotein component of BamABCDE complex)
MVSLLVTVGCTGSPVHQTLTQSAKATEIRKNHENLLQLQIGMSSEQAAEIVGKPAFTEGYEWGTAWMYRTAMSSGVYSEAPEDFTPVLLNPEGKVAGWGRSAYEEKFNR